MREPSACRDRGENTTCIGAQAADAVIEVAKSQSVLLSQPSPQRRLRSPEDVRLGHGARSVAHPIVHLEGGPRGAVGKERLVAPTDAGDQGQRGRAEKAMTEPSGARTLPASDDRVLFGIAEAHGADDTS